MILQCVGDSNIPLKYRWYKDGTMIVNMTSDAYYSLPFTSRNDTGNYSCEIVSRLGREISDGEAVTIQCKSFCILY